MCAGRKEYVTKVNDKKEKLRKRLILLILEN